MVGAGPGDAGDTVGAWFPGWTGTMRETESAATTVGIVEDHPVFRRGLQQAVQAASHLELLFAVPSVEDFRTQVARPDVIVVDLGLPGVRGAEAVAAVGERGAAVLVVSAENKQRDVLDAIAAGARGYLTKSAEPEEVIRAIGLIAAGEVYVSPTLASFFIRDAKEDTSAASGLSAREREILGLVAAGETDQDIAESLFISVRTVRSHLDRIRDKTGRRRRADLTRLAVEEGLLDEVEKRRGPGS